MARYRSKDISMRRQDCENAEKVTNKLCDMMQQNIDIRPPSINITCSILGTIVVVSKRSAKAKCLRKKYMG
ncbi:hypothetical protein FKM82_007458 [Ascaphus truei]